MTKSGNASWPNNGGATGKFERNAEVADRTDKPSLVSIFNPLRVLQAHEERPARSSQSSNSNPCSASEGDDWKRSHEPVGYIAVEMRRMVIATSKESRRVLTGSVGGKSGESIFNYQYGKCTIAQGDIQDDTDGSLDYFKIFRMDWQRIGETALRRDRF